MSECKPLGMGIPIGGVTVHFPAGLVPHVPQKITMSKVISSLKIGPR